ncbi:MAG TPA: DUF5722 domain-containing protein [Chloroflexota bacterium]|nr:DUF5722 domain-containing protein [Chloroflexota bacterium]
MRDLLRLLKNLGIIALFLTCVVGGAAVTWHFMPEGSRHLLRDPLDYFFDTRDEVIAADGTPAGISVLPAWTGADRGRFFGATETIWQSRRAQVAGVRWSRVVFYWSEIQPGGPREWRAPFYLPDRMINKERQNGIEVVGLLMNTPRWAQSAPGDGTRSVPSGLDRHVDDPSNLWAAFVRRMAAEYRGRIDTWIIWNEMDIRPAGPNSQYYTWAGDENDYARLLRVASLAARQGNPNAKIVFGATTYWADQNDNRPLFVERTLAALSVDPEAPRQRYYFDAAAINLYTSPDDLGRVAAVYRAIFERFGLSAPLWLTETNATPYDDPMKGLGREQNGLRVTLDQQAAYVVQAFAMGLAAGYERMAFHSTMDRSTDDEVWGLVRNDGTLRPAFVAYQTAARHLSGGHARFAGRERAQWRWPAGGFVPNWQAYLVAVERLGPEGGELVSVVWNGDGEPRTVFLPVRSEQATLVDKYGRPQPLVRDGDRWRLTLAPATAHSPIDPEGYYFIGGDPLVLVERGVSGSALASIEPPIVLS